MPARLTFRSATSHLCMRAERALDELRDPRRRALAFGDAVDDFLSARDAVAAGEVARVRRLHRALVDDDAPAIQPNVGQALEQLEMQIGRASCRERVEVAVV